MKNQTIRGTELLEAKDLSLVQDSINSPNAFLYGVTFCIGEFIPRKRPYILKCL